jgi:hypothetical protein
MTDFTAHGVLPVLPCFVFRFVSGPLLLVAQVQESLRRRRQKVWEPAAPCDGGYGTAALSRHAAETSAIPGGLNLALGGARDPTAAAGQPGVTGLLVVVDLGSTWPENDLGIALAHLCHSLSSQVSYYTGQERRKKLKGCHRFLQSEEDESWREQNYQMDLQQPRLKRPR